MINKYESDESAGDTARRVMCALVLVIVILAALSCTACTTTTPMSRGMEVATAALFGGAITADGTPLMAPSQPQASPAFEAFYR
jgi:hypothetical protein